MIQISHQTRMRIQALFPKDQWSDVECLLISDCGDSLPLVRPDATELAERIRFAVLKLSQGDFDALRKAVTDASIDWRDSLVMAGFGHDTRAHFDWHPKRHEETGNKDIQQTDS